MNTDKVKTDDQNEKQVANEEVSSGVETRRILGSVVPIHSKDTKDQNCGTHQINLKTAMFS